jgi:plasmid stabilization system protein ParE
MGKMHVVKTEQFHLDLEQLVLYVARDNITAALALEALIHRQVERLADPSVPRRPGRVSGTMELVAHPNDIVLLQQTETNVTALALMHVARRYP